MVEHGQLWFLMALVNDRFIKAYDLNTIFDVQIMVYAEEGFQDFLYCGEFKYSVIHSFIAMNETLLLNIMWQIMLMCCPDELSGASVQCVICEVYNVNPEYFWPTSALKIFSPVMLVVAITVNKRMLVSFLKADAFD